MSSKINLRNSLIILSRMVKYNLKIIFANKFVWFLIVSFAIFAFISFQFVWEGATIDDGTIYGLLMFPGILLIFYPTVFGIQNDDDSRMLEILFGIPNYRYKVWLVRLFMIFVLVFLVLIFYAWTASILLYKINILEMAYQLMYPIVFLGALSFMFSTIIKNGNGTAVTMVLIGVALLIFTDSLERTQWNIFLNPFNLPNNFNEVIWAGLIVKNRIFLAVGMVICILYGLFNLQKREKFV